MNVTKIFGPTVLVMLVGSQVNAGDLRFGFVNPSFGGNPNVGSFLFGLAEAQSGATRNDVAGASGSGGDGDGDGGIGSPGDISAPTISIPITIGSPTTNTEAAVDQVTQ